MSIILAVVLRRQRSVNSPDPRCFLDTSRAHLAKAGAAGKSPTVPPTGLNEINGLGSRTWNCN